MKDSIWLRMACVGGAASALLMSAGLYLSRYGAAGCIAAGLLAAAAGAFIATASARWYDLSITDDGTGIYNRRYLFRRLESELSNARKAGTPLSLVVFDVDDFRQYNSLYGHLAGDAVLKAVAQTLRNSVRKGDIVGRWGGEEFALVLPGTDVKEALSVAERVRGRIDELTVDTGEAARIKVTISGGVAVYRDPGESMSELVRSADQAMYNAKKFKNKVLPFIRENSREAGIQDNSMGLPC